MTEQTPAEMQARRDVVEEEIASIKAKLEHVRAKRHATGEYADPDWYRRASTRLRFLGNEHQRLLRGIADARRQAKASANASIERAFVGIAKDRLDPLEFNTILEKAREQASAASINQQHAPSNPGEETDGRPRQSGDHRGRRSPPRAAAARRT